MKQHPMNPIKMQRLVKLLMGSGLCFVFLLLAVPMQAHANTSPSANPYPSLSTSANGSANTSSNTTNPNGSPHTREALLERALLQQYSNQILDHIQSRTYCAHVLGIHETPPEQGASTSAFTTDIGVVSKDLKGRFVYTKLTVTDDIMGVQVAKVTKPKEISKAGASKFCGTETMAEHVPLRDHFPPRYTTSEVDIAKRIPMQYINLINEKRYDKAVALLTPDRQKDYRGPAGQQALKNIEHIHLEKLVDISYMKPVDHYMDRHFAVKTYAAILDVQVHHPELYATCPGAIGRQVRKFEVVQFTPDSPWLVNATSGVPPATARLWGLDIGKGDWDFCQRFSQST